MTPSDEPQSIPTLFDALQTETVDALKERANLVSGSEQTQLVRKANLIEFIKQRMTGDHLQALWQRLDTLQQALVAETAHGPNPWLDADRAMEESWCEAHEQLLRRLQERGIASQRTRALAPGAWPVPIVKPEAVEVEPTVQNQRRRRALAQQQRVID